jgi:hypothetical protein
MQGGAAAHHGCVAGTGTTALANSRRIASEPGAALRGEYGYGLASRHETEGCCCALGWWGHTWAVQISVHQTTSQDVAPGRHDLDWQELVQARS